MFCGEIQFPSWNYLSQVLDFVFLRLSREQLAAAADQIANQGAARVDPFLEGAKIEHEQFGSRIISESERQVCFHLRLNFQRNLLLEEAEEVGNGPKDIALFCASVCFTMVFCLCSPHKSVFRTWIAIWWEKIFACCT